MREGNKLPTRPEIGRIDTHPIILAIMGPLIGLGFILVLPFVGIAIFILLFGYRILQSLSTLWRKLVLETIGKLETVRWEEADQIRFLQPLVDGLGCEFIVIGLDLRITRYRTPLSRKNKVLEQAAIGQYCFEVTHRRNSICESYECECPITKILETNDKVTVTHYHESPLEGTDKKKRVNILALPIRDNQSKITQIAELIFDTDIPMQIKPVAGQQ